MLFPLAFLGNIPLPAKPARFEDELKVSCFLQSSNKEKRRRAYV